MRVVRLYIDGDFDSLGTLEFWMHLCQRHEGELSFYGYSKSWDIFLAYHRKHGGRWPSNYALNLSSGTLWEKIGGDAYQRKIDEMMALPVTRGRFVAITGVESHMPKMTEKEASNTKDPRGKAGWSEHMAEVRKVARETAHKYGFSPTAKVFSCPGKCYACLSPGDAPVDSPVADKRYGRHACGDMKLRGVVIAIAVHGTGRVATREGLPAVWPPEGPDVSGKRERYVPPRIAEERRLRAEQKALRMRGEMPED